MLNMVTFFNFYTLVNRNKDINCVHITNFDQVLT